MLTKIAIHYLVVIFCCWKALINVSVASGIDSVSNHWTKTELALINSLWIDNLGAPPSSPSNQYADNPLAVKLGEKIFNDPRFSANGKVSCATCHKAEYNFTDNLVVAKGIGLSERRSMPAVGMAYHRWFFWDGRNDSLWSQALGPLENINEHGISRTQVVQLIFKHYYSEYQSAITMLPAITISRFPASARPDRKNQVVNKQWTDIPLQDREKITRVFVNIGKAIAAYVRTLKPTPSTFDLYAKALFDRESAPEGLNQLNLQQKKGLRLFIGKAKCIICHNGPLLSNGEFHHVGAPDNNRVDYGRAVVVNTIVNSEFSCLSRWSDADKERDCQHVGFLDVDAAKYFRAFKTPSLRNVAIRSPYTHAGQLSTLLSVLKNYRDVSDSEITDEIFHGSLTDAELEQLKVFLESLTSL